MNLPFFAPFGSAQDFEGHGKGNGIMNSTYAYKSLLIGLIIILMTVIIKNITDRTEPGSEVPVEVPVVSFAEPTGLQKSLPMAIKPKYTREWKGSYCGIKKSLKRVVKDFDTWEKLWVQFISNQQYMVTVPEVDFTKKMVVVLTMGEKQNDRYQIAIKSMNMKKNTLIISYTETKPSPSEKSLRTIPSQPYHLKVVRSHPARVIFRKAR